MRRRRRLGLAGGDAASSRGCLRKRQGQGCTPQSDLNTSSMGEQGVASLDQVRQEVRLWCHLPLHIVPRQPARPRFGLPASSLGWWRHPCAPPIGAPRQVVVLHRTAGCNCAAGVELRGCHAAPLQCRLPPGSASCATSSASRCVATPLVVETHPVAELRRVSSRKSRPPASAARQRRATSCCGTPSSSGRRTHRGRAVRRPAPARVAPSQACPKEALTPHASLRARQARLS
jgi:hypothetical protein